MSELATVARYRPDLSIVVFVDGQYGNVERIQRQTFGATFATELTNPDFAMLARAYGLAFVGVDSADALHPALVAAAQRGGPTLIAVTVGASRRPGR